MKARVSDKFLTCPAGNFVSQEIAREIATQDLILTNTDKLASEVDVTCNSRENSHIVSSLRLPERRSKLQTDFKISTSNYYAIIFSIGCKMFGNPKSLKKKSQLIQNENVVYFK